MMAAYRWKMKVICWQYLPVTVCIILLTISSVTNATKSKPKSVTTLLNSKWKQTPLVLEIRITGLENRVFIPVRNTYLSMLMTSKCNFKMDSEYLADESNDIFWAYVDHIAKQDPDALKAKTDKDYHDFLITETRKLISVPMMALLKLSLSLRIYSPIVEMFQQIALDKPFPPDCDAVFEVNGIFSCNVGELEDLMSAATDRNKSEILALDHHYPGSDMNPTAIILYAEVGTKSFQQFHKAMKTLVKDGKAHYILRHYLKKRSEKKVRLSGFGVELAIKSTEYKAQDDTKVKSDETSTADDGDESEEEVDGFMFTKLKQLHPKLSKKLESLKAHLQESSTEMLPLKVWQIQELSLQAAQRIMSTSVDEALRLMRDIAQNFPQQTHSLVKTVIKDELKKEILKNQKLFAENNNIAPSDAALFINGIHFDMEVADIYSILDVIREEQRIMDGLHTLGVQESQLSQMQTLDFQTDKQEYAVDIRDSAIQYINDLENDRKYYSWASSISEILRPTYPGVLRTIRKNIYHLVFVMDPSKESSKDLLKLAESFYIHNAPVRIGIVFTVNRDKDKDGFEDAGVALLNAFNFISQEKNQPYAGLSFITDVYADVGEQPVTSTDVVEAFKLKYPQEDLELIFGDDSDYDTGRKLAWEYVDRTGLPAPPQVLMNGVPIDEGSLTTDLFEEAVLHEVMRHTSLVQKAVYKNEISDFNDVLDHLMSRPNVMPRLNDRVLSGKGDYLDFTGRPILEPTFSRFSKLSTRDMSGTLIAHLRYLTARDDFAFRPVTVWVVCDLETEKGRQILSEAIEQVKLSNDIRIGVLYNCPADGSALRPFTNAVHVALGALDKTVNKAFIGKILLPNNAEAIISGRKSVVDFAVKGMDVEAYEVALKAVTDDFIKIHRLYCDRILHVKAGERLVIANGRIIGPLESDEVFNVDDFNLLEKYSMNTFGEKLQKTFEEINDQGEQDSVSDLAMRVTALLMNRKSKRDRQEIEYSSIDYSVVQIPSRLPGQPSFDIKAIVDPVSRGAQKLAPLLMTIYEVVNARIWVFLNSEDKLSDLPLKNFYRYVLEPQLQFASDGSALPGPTARFHNMPQQPILTLRMITPDNWLVEVVKSPHDLDNIRLNDVQSTITSEFELEHLLLEGHCFEQATGNPPRGLQFVLGTNSTPALGDTIVMANLGYFQLKANPGGWILRLRYGRSAEIYDIASVDGVDLPSGSSEAQILLSSFKTHIVKLKVTKKPGKHHMDLLSDDSGGSGIWNSITSTFGTNKAQEEEEQESKLNIFSLASGHLYERFLRIMMLSVLKHTKTPVKFWFLKNYLSPTIKDFLPVMAKKYGFEYELVHYQWPRWLHQQTEKQRTIWGYKILFLDVLFPLDVKKIIFVDADQIVRTDLKELRDLDLGGAPYGYTPFCESRRDMDGYRFWKSGYWATHLQGRRYHISALYVVDLKKFRRIAAGDRLRGQYQGLSQDPNSLSNLDQDLPNNMIHQVNIKSLPQEWLWCETWCDENTKAKAKTIDLCNNPKTKEPKLASAMRIVPEWKTYDSEIKKLMDIFETERKNVTSGTTTQKKPSEKHGHEEL